MISINQTAYGWLDNAGNQNIEFVTFPGGHDYIEENVINMYLWMRSFVNPNIISSENQPISLQTEQLNCFPNPFQTNTEIRFFISSAYHTQLDIYNQLGQLTELLIDEKLSAGEHSITWIPDASPGGIYYCRLKSGNNISTLKVMPEDKDKGEN